MGLQIEEFDSVDKKGTPRKVAVADDIPGQWRDWFQGRRIELNAMTTAQFLDWLDKKMEEQGGKKVIPGTEVMKDHLQQNLREKIRQERTEAILKAAKVDELVEAELQKLANTVESKAKELPDMVADAFDDDPVLSWREPVERVAAELAQRATKDENRQNRGDG